MLTRFNRLSNEGKNPIALRGQSPTGVFTLLVTRQNEAQYPFLISFFLIQMSGNLFEAISVNDLTLSQWRVMDNANQSKYK